MVFKGLLQHQGPIVECVHIFLKKRNVQVERRFVLLQVWIVVDNQVQCTKLLEGSIEDDFFKFVQDGLGV